MLRKESQLKKAREEAQSAVNRTNEKIEELGKSSAALYSVLNEIQEAFDAIRNIPAEKKLQYEELKNIRLNWKQQAEKIEKDYKNATVKNAGAGAAGAGAGIAVAMMGPTAAMGIATTFGVASTGTAISSLSGAAATHAALAWLGGGALATGGGGMAAGEALLALAGPVGWAIAGVSLLTSGLLLWKSQNDKKCIENVYTLISERDVNSYNLAIVELNERINRITDETGSLRNAIIDIHSFGLEYDSMSEAQQYALGSYVNLMSASTQLLVNPILGLQPHYTEADLEIYISRETDEKKAEWYSDYKLLIVSLANFLYKIKLNEREKKLLWKSLRKNRKVLKSLEVSKKDFDIEIINAAVRLPD